ncbi:unnamed protein product [Cylindrotheca closterium]|uniref:Ndc10 domain-containing protein n=1 Tax=Cylindrotheca closterium TaxID=2856 RepID=A0AAD2GDD6_9STRA|nr:unnamed protein product [Cylindrotheca closterium]
MVVPQFGVGRTEIVQQQPYNRSPGQALADGARHVEAQSQLQQHQQWVGNVLDAIAKPNTKAAYEPKEAEFLEFCRVVYGDDPVPCHVTFEKVYKFFYYVVHRQVRPRGKKKGTSGYFNLEEYNRIWSATRGSPDTDTNHVPPHLCFGDLPEGEGSSPGYDCFNQYKCAIKKLHEKNLRNKTTGLDWNQEIWTPWCKDLELLVKRRKGVMKKVHHKEKMNPDHTLLKGKGKDKLIEEEMWREGFTKSTLRNAFGSIRHRLMFLFTLSGVLRMESLHSAELSDCFLIKGRNEAKESQDWDCLIMQMCDGKTNRGKVFYGRSMRHKNVLLCPIGALGFYLLSRFKLSGEFEEDRCPDFTDNSAWYDIKLLVSFGTHNGAETAEEGRKRPIKPKNFSDSMREILGKLGIPSTHLQHLGRLFGNMNLQYLEIDEEFIRMLGNWAVNIRDQCYSTHLPLKAMRAAAGFTTSEGRYYNPRALVVPPEELEKKIFPFADRALEKVEAACKSKGSRMGGYYLGTARGFLEMLLRLRTIILQDAAAMKVLHPERCDGHMFFQAFPELFRNQLFLEYTAKMRLELSHAVEVRTATVDAVLPGVIEHFNSLGQGVRRNGEDIMEVKKDVNDLKEAIPAMMRDTTLATWQAAIMRDTMLATWHDPTASHIFRLKSKELKGVLDGR